MRRRNEPGDADTCHPLHRRPVRPATGPAAMRRGDGPAAPVRPAADLATMRVGDGPAAPARPARSWRERPTPGSAALAGFALACAFGAAVVEGKQAHPAEQPEPTEAQALENPVEPTRASLRAGRQRYVFLCRQCHGNRGAGDGDMSHAGGIPSDFTDDVWQHGASDGEIFTVIKEGVSADMQGYGNQLRDEDIWNLVNYLKSLSR